MTELNSAQATLTPSWLLPSTFSVQLTMCSDWHVGSGTGRPGSVDRLVTRDIDGLPYVPAKTLTGIWRDAMERLTFGLDESEEDGNWSQWVDILFGSQPALVQGIQTLAPRSATLTIQPARLHTTLRDRLSGDQNTPLQQALTFVKPGVAIDPTSGQSRPRFLRFEEMARMGTMLYTECTLAVPEDPEQHAVASALLLASAKLVERIGGKRRRGAGRCVLTIVQCDDEPALQWLHDHASPPSPPAPYPAATTTVTLQNVKRETNGTWWHLPIALTLQTPLSVAARTLGNITETLDYVPGTLLLPYLTRTLQSIGYDCRPDIASGALQVLSATREVHGTRALPVPYALWCRKAGGGFTIPGSIRNRLTEAVEASTQFKGLRGGYLASAHGSQTLPAYDRVPLDLLTHNTVEDALQRPTENVGGVYSREAIAAGTVLHTELRLQATLANTLSSQNATWWERLTGVCRLGVSRKDDYGMVQLDVLGHPQPMTHLPPFNPNDLRRLTVWLLSDVLLRDEVLRPSSASAQLQAELEDRLQVKLSIASVPEGCLNPCIRVHRVESWHTGWGLPRPSFVAMAAGSCAVFEIEQGDLQPEHMLEIEASGIGERRAEGYGQLCFNAPLLTNQLSHWNAAEKRNPDEVIPRREPLTSDEDAYAKRVELAAWREVLQRVVLGLAADPEKRTDILGIEIIREQDTPPRSSPSMSQLSGLRTALSGFKEAADAETVRQWLYQLANNPNRSSKRPDEALQCLSRLLQNESHIWTIMGEDWQDPPMVSDRSPADLRKELWPEAVRSLVDACIRAHKRAIEPTFEEDNEYGA